MKATLEDFVTFTNYHYLLDEGFETLAEQVNMFLEDVEAQITAFLGSDNWENQYGSDVVARGRQMHIVRRYFDNQEGYSSESFDGYSASFSDGAAEGLRLSEYDKTVLAQQRQQTRSKVTTIGLTRSGFPGVW